MAEKKFVLPYQKLASFESKNKHPVLSSKMLASKFIEAMEGLIKNNEKRALAVFSSFLQEDMLMQKAFDPSRERLI